VLSVTPSTRIASIMGKINDIEGIPVKCQRLSTYDGKDLDPNCSVSDYNIQPESIINLNLRLLGGMPPKTSSDNSSKGSRPGKKQRGNADTVGKRKHSARSRAKDSSRTFADIIDKFQEDKDVDIVITKQAERCLANDCKYRGAGTKGCFWNIFSLVCKFHISIDILRTFTLK